MKRSILWTLALSSLAWCDFLSLGGGVLIPEPGIQSKLPARIEILGLLQASPYAQVRLSLSQFEISGSQARTQTALGSSAVLFPIPQSGAHMDLNYTKMLSQESSSTGDESWTEYGAGIGYLWKLDPKLSLDLGAGEIWTTSHNVDSQRSKLRSTALKLSFFFALI